MNSTKVIHMKDRKGTADEVYIGRPSEWGNPFSVKEYGREGCIKRYELQLNYRLNKEQEEGHSTLRNKIKNLYGKTLVCWCSPQPCHGDVLAEMAELAASEDYDGRA